MWRFLGEAWDDDEDRKAPARSLVRSSCPFLYVQRFLSQTWDDDEDRKAPARSRPLSHISRLSAPPGAIGVAEAAEMNASAPPLSVPPCGCRTKHTYGGSAVERPRAELRASVCAWDGQ
jgi:hypothetical protein